MLLSAEMEIDADSVCSTFLVSKTQQSTLGRVIQLGMVLISITGKSIFQCHGCYTRYAEIMTKVSKIIRGNS